MDFRVADTFIENLAPCRETRNTRDFQPGGKVEVLVPYRLQDSTTKFDD